MSRFAGILRAANQRKAFVDSAGEQLAPSDAKDLIVRTLEPFLNDHGVLDRYATSLLAVEAINVRDLRDDRWALLMLTKCLETYRAAHRVAGDTSIRSCAYWESSVMEGLSSYWSAYHLEIPKDGLCLEEFQFELFRNIGTIIEASLKPLLRCLLSQVLMRDGEEVSCADLSKQNLGETVEYLVQRSGYRQLFMPPPWGIRLNQWRNIADHRSSRVEEGVIVAEYGVAPKARSIQVTRDELLQVGRRVSSVYSAIRTARSLFLVDNMDTWQRVTPVYPVRVEAEILNLVVGVGTQGFSVTDIRLTDCEAQMIVQEASRSDPSQRRIHASQLVVPLWVSTRRPCVRVEYLEKDGTPGFRAAARAEDCDRVTRGELGWGEFAGLVEMVDLKSGRVIPRSEDS